MAPSTRSLRSSTRLSAPAAPPAEEKKTPAKKKAAAPPKEKKEKLAKEDKSTDEPEKSRGGRKRKVDPEPEAEPEEVKPAKKAKKPDAPKKGSVSSKTVDELKSLRDASAKGPDVNPDAEPRDPPGTRYWLMKSEPEPRFEDGYEIKFSIDDLIAKKTPEGWEGIRNYSARNNMRAMRIGDKAFFYHSNCKVPGIAGIIKIVKEYSPDWNACINDNPYYDAAAPHDGSKWSLVHVRIEQKFPRIVPLSMLREAKALQGSELIRQGRLSVCKISGDEWEAVIGMAKELDEDGEWDKTVEEVKKYPNYLA
ncbi:at dna binding protein [Colletotrichum plurivorum]|uniref:Thymocyte nuclear protein 1 n=1 Tax=Colletotrichum plurivorum TaxID=2175906 RepID=A0A8H6KF55_9PEZI|nr:at dna binding protein [Colletotrichum plurivorum]